MKQKLTLLTLLVILCFSGIELQAQNRSLGTKSRELSLPDDLAFTPVKETYTYYEDEDGNYVKHGSYSMTGKKNENVANGYSKANQTCDYSLKANYKDGLLHGTVTASRTCKVTARNNLSGASMAVVTKVDFTGGYSEGLPHGAWTYTNVYDGETKASVKINFTHGVMTGSYLVLAENNMGVLVTTKGQLDAEGFLIGKWTSTGTLTDVQSTYERGVEISSTARNAEGVVTRSEKIDPEIKEAAYKFINGEATLEELKQMGYPQLIIDARKDGYYRCFSESNYLSLDRLTGRLTADSRLIYIEDKVGKETITGKSVWFSKIGIMTDELHNAMLAKEGINVVADPSLVVKIKSTDTNNPAYFFKHSVGSTDKHRFFGYKCYVELSCGEEYPLMKYYMTEEQYTKGDEMYRAYEAEKRRIEAERLAAEKRARELYNQRSAALRRKINSVPSSWNGMDYKDERNLYEYFNSIVDKGWHNNETIADLEIITDNVQNIFSGEDISEISRYINEYNKYDMLINYGRPDSVTVRRAIHDTEERRMKAEVAVKGKIAGNIFRDIAEITKCGFSMGSSDYRYAQEDKVLESLKTGCDKEFLRLYMIIYKAYSRNSLEDYDMMLRVNQSMKTLHSNKIKSYSQAKKVAKKIETYDEAINFFINDAIGLCQFQTTQTSSAPIIKLKTPSSITALKNKLVK